MFRNLIIMRHTINDTGSYVVTMGIFIDITQGWVLCLFMPGAPGLQPEGINIRQAMSACVTSFIHNILIPHTTLQYSLSPCMHDMTVTITFSLWLNMYFLPYSHRYNQYYAWVGRLTLKQM